MQRGKETPTALPDLIQAADDHTSVTPRPDQSHHAVPAPSMSVNPGMVMVPLLLPTPTSRTASRTHRRASPLVATGLMLLAIALSACSGAERATAPISAVSARAATGTNQSLTEAFLNAQGTYCVRDIPGDCDVIDKFDLGYILGWCILSCAENPALTADFAAVNRKWWDLNGLPSYAPYSYTGGVTESRLADGRRRLVVNIHARNTFVTLSTQVNGSAVIVGADGTEFPNISDQPNTPTLGDVSLAAELILPATYVGMPDITHFTFFPEAGMEIRRLSLTISTSGPLRVAYDGLAAGTDVDVRGHFVYLPKLGEQVTNNRRLITRNFEVMSRITVQLTTPP